MVFRPSVAKEWVRWAGGCRLHDAELNAGRLRVTLCGCIRQCTTVVQLEAAGAAVRCKPATAHA